MPEYKVETDYFIEFCDNKKHAETQTDTDVSRQILQLEDSKHEDGLDDFCKKMSPIVMEALYNNRYLFI